MMQRALITRDFSLAYVQQVGSTTTPPLYNVAAMWSSLEGSILLWAIVLAGYTAAVAWRFRRRTADPLVGWALVVMFVVAAFFALVSFGPASPFQNGPPRCSRRARSEPAAPEPRPRAVPPTDPVPGLRRVHGAVRVRDRGPDHGSRRRGMVDGDQALGAVRVGTAHDRHPARRLVELRGARLERRVGVGSRRERQPPAVADGDRVHPLGARAGAAGDAARVEPQPARRHVRADDPRHVPHAVGRDQQCPRVRRRAGRRLPPRVLRARRRGVAGAHRVAW